MKFGLLGDQCEAQTRSVSGGVDAAIEACEDGVAFIGWDAGAVVVHGYCLAVGVSTGRDLDDGRIAVLGGVGECVVEDQTQSAGQPQYRQGRVAADGDGYARVVAGGVACCFVGEFDEIDSDVLMPAAGQFSRGELFQCGQRCLDAGLFAQDVFDDVGALLAR